MSSDSLVEVRLLGLPVELRQRSSAHWEGVQREFDLIRHSLGDAGLPGRMLDLVESLRDRFGSYGDAADQQIRAGAEAGVETIDLVYQIPRAAADGARELQAMLDEADAYCRQELILPSSADITSFRRWFLAEFIRQIDEGLAPTRWSAEFIAIPEEERDPVTPTGREAGWLVVNGDIDLATAGGLRERIRAVLDEGIRTITLDLTDVSFLDSVGLGLLVATHQRLTEDGQSLAVVVPSHLDMLFEVSGLKGLFDFRPVPTER